MKNSTKIKEILIKLAIEGKLPSDMNDLDESLFNFTNKLPDNCFNAWCLKDIEWVAIGIGINLSEKEIIAVKDLCEKYFDAGVGFSSEDIKGHIKSIIKERKQS